MGAQVLKIEGDFESKSTIKVFGPSGSGKSTFLKILAGFIRPEYGFIKFDGNIWLDTSKKVYLLPQKRNIGFVFQEYALFPHMTVRQHLTYASKDKAWIERLLVWGQLQTLSSHKPEFLSGGQQQRLAIIRALAIKPKLLLMDEPFSALDPEMKCTLLPEFKELMVGLDATAFIVSHNPDELSGWATQDLFINSVTN